MSDNKPTFKHIEALNLPQEQKDDLQKKATELMEVLCGFLMRELHYRNADNFVSMAFNTGRDGDPYYQLTFQRGGKLNPVERLAQLQEREEELLQVIKDQSVHLQRLKDDTASAVADAESQLALAMTWGAALAATERDALLAEVERLRASEEVWREEALAAGRFEDSISDALGIPRPDDAAVYLGEGRRWCDVAVSRIRQLRAEIDAVERVEPARDEELKE